MNMPGKLHRVGMMFPTRTDATSLYRGVGPFSLLEKQIAGLVCKEMIEIDWSTLAGIDMLFMQRPWVEMHHFVATRAKVQRIPLWVDYDDNLFHVPPWNPAYKTYMTDVRQKALAEIIAMADVVTVTCDELKQHLIPLNKNVITIPNAWNDFMFPIRQRTNQERKKLITWRGSNTHRNDLISVQDQIIELSHKHLDVTWNFIGEMPWFAEKMPEKNVILTPSLDPLDYFEYLWKIGPSIHIAPLTDIPFNRSKSNIVWQEATWAGAAVLAPNFQEFQKPGIMTYNNPDEFQFQLERMMTGEVSLEALHNTSMAYMTENLRLSNINEKRYEIIASLLGLELPERVPA